MEEQDLLGTLLGKELEPGAVRELLEGMGLKPTYENGIYLQILRMLVPEILVQSGSMRVLITPLFIEIARK